MNFAQYPSLAGRTIVVTGGASGIGAAIVRNFAWNGARVAFIDIDIDAARSLVDGIAGQGVDSPVFFNCDLLDLEATTRTLETIQNEIGPIRGLVNNAANDTRRPLETVDAEHFEWSINVNFRHVFFCTQVVIPWMAAAGGGSIVNMSSLAWVKGTRDLQAYSAAKAGIIGFTSSLAHKVGPMNIRANVITPGATMTERQTQLWFDDAARDAILDQQCIREHVEPDDIARMALFLVSDDSRHITKQCFAVDCGR